jgi:hypothetical protein
MAVTLGVPTIEADDLAHVSAVFAEPPARLEAHPFDGAALAQVAGIVSTGGIPVLIAWINARAEARKHMSISVNGVEATGYTINELQPVLDMLQNEQGPE